MPDNPHKLCRLGDALIQQKKAAEAIDCFEHALAISEDYATAHNRLGAVYVRTQQPALALDHFRRCAELEPDSANALTNLANVYPQLRRHAEAIPLLERALKLDPNFAPAHRLYWQVLAAMDAWARRSTPFERRARDCRTNSP